MAKKLFTLGTLLLFRAMLALFGFDAVYAGEVIQGRVTDMETGEPLPYATIVAAGTPEGTKSDLDGYFSLSGLEAGKHTLEASYLTYQTVQVLVEVKAAGRNYVDIALVPQNILASQIVVIADRARERETPVAFTQVNKKQIRDQLGSRDIPLVMNTTPSVYSTMQGGGAGDARINVRGFDQRNVAIMINGIPVNDMENGWVYWSNWDGLGDFASSIQMQRGLSAVNLAVPSIGGTMNILTDPAAMEPGVSLKQEFGNDGLWKTTVIGNTGLIDDRFALSGGVVRKEGDGYVDKSWTDAWAYYLGASWMINESNRLELYALGAPQRHGQNLYKQNIAVYDNDYARDLDDYDPAAFDDFQERGRRFNQNWSPVSSSYTGRQYWNGEDHERYDSSFINERENYYHKPLVHLNWYSRFTDDLFLLSSLYYSGGKGGGTGTYGKVYTRDANGELGDDDWKYYYGPSPWYRDWNRTIAVNSAGAGTYYVDKKAIEKEDGESIGILRNSVNEQWTIGALSKLHYEPSEELDLVAGIDIRTAEIDHFREVRDLLGGDYFRFTGNDFDATENDYRKTLGDKIDYYFTNNVDWFGVYGQAEYKKDDFTGYAMSGWSTINYKHTNHFIEDSDGDELVVESGNIDGYQVKGGMNYNLSEDLNVFANAGYVSKVPIFDQVISDRDGSLAEDPENEKFTSYEGGLVYRTPSRDLTLRGNVYYTTWKDRSKSTNVRNDDGSEGLVFLKGIDSRYYGLELEMAYQPSRLFRIDGAASFGAWEYTDDISGSYIEDYASGTETFYTYYVKDLKVGDAPQTQFALAGTVFPVKGFQVQLVWRHYADHYAKWDPFSRTELEDTNGDGVAEERPQSWKVPEYSVFDLHASYKLPLKWENADIRLFAHVFNLFDEVYIQDATDNSKYSSFDDDHDADDAEVFFGLPRTWNVGVELIF